MLAAFDGLIPGAGEKPGMPGCVAGAVGAATGAVPFCTAPGAAVAAGMVVAGDVAVAGAVVVGEPAPAGAGGVVCPNQVSASSAAEQMDAVRSFFIG